jgi:hypothetical protein
MNGGAVGILDAPAETRGCHGLLSKNREGCAAEKEGKTDYI